MLYNTTGGGLITISHVTITIILKRNLSALCFLDLAITIRCRITKKSDIVCLFNVYFGYQIPISCNTFLVKEIHN